MKASGHPERSTHMPGPLWAELLSVQKQDPGVAGGPGNKTFPQDNIQNHVFSVYSVQAPCLATSRKSCEPPGEAEGLALLLVPVYRCGNESSERFRGWSEATQPVNSRAGREASTPESVGYVLGPGRGSPS